MPFLWIYMEVTNLIRHTMAHQHTRSARPITSPSIRPSTNTRTSKNVTTSQRKSVNTWKKRYFVYLFIFADFLVHFHIVSKLKNNNSGAIPEFLCFGNPEVQEWNVFGNSVFSKCPGIGFLGIGNLGLLNFWESPDNNKSWKFSKKNSNFPKKSQFWGGFHVQ